MRLSSAPSTPHRRIPPLPRWLHSIATVTVISSAPALLLPLLLSPCQPRVVSALSCPTVDPPPSHHHSPQPQMIHRSILTPTRRLILLVSLLLPPRCRL